MNRLLTLIFGATLTVAITSGSMYAQTTTPTKPAEPQPSQSMQEMYDKLHGNTNKKPATQPTKSKTTTPPKSTTKPQTAQKSAPAPAPKAAAPAEEGGFKFKVGLRGGANYCNFSVPSSQTSSGVTLEPIIGYHGGLILSFGGKVFSVQPEILYSQVGAKLTTTQGGITLSGESKINTVTVPVLLRFALGGESFKFFINGGGYGSYALNGKAKATLNQQTTESDIKFDKEDSRIEYGAVGGAGISLGLGKAQLLIEGRYYYGLGNDDGDLDANEKSFVRNIQGSIGILIPIGGK
ncbi:porin family protein [Runella aurantiaca]|uniref:PorT family protein n=1 Tax=Runella aurantiaca TaxID=2282308 RepID=A0A369IEV5_9BACT|nr:porin family protein [Runella aurantiaca]RDB05156.1 PorT family protein [Runella aurantiaca]